MRIIKKHIFQIKVVIATFILIVAAPLWAALPEPENDYVNDFAHVMNAQDYMKTEQALKALRAQTGIEMTLVTINSIDAYMKIEGEGTTRIESFATILFNHWGVGNAQTDNGVMVLFSAQDRQVRIELGRLYGSEYDQKMREVVSLMLPYFKKGEYSAGLTEGIYATIRMVQNESINAHLPFYQRYMIEMIVGALVTLCIFAGISCMRNGKTGWGWAFFTIAMMLVLWLIKRRSGRRRGGFGGGRSGGGGASGSW